MIFLFWASGALGQGSERVLEVEGQEPIRYRLLDASAPDSDSARLTAERMLKHLSNADIEEAAVMSTQPRRRFEELAKYLLTVGPDEFKRVFWQYLNSGPASAEIAIDEHRLLIFDLVEGRERRLAGQYFVRIEGRFLLDDVPNQTRLRLRQVLEAYRAGTLKF